MRKAIPYSFAFAVSNIWKQFKRAPRVLRYIHTIKYPSAEKEMRSIFIFCWGVSPGCIINQKMQVKKSVYDTLLFI